jgi:hypothetical protein
VAIALSLALVGIAVWAVNPYAALVLAPALHTWTLAALAPVRRGTALGLIAVGLAPPALVALYYCLHFSLGPLAAAWYGFLLVTGHQTGLAATLLACALAGLFVALLTLAIARRDVRASRERPASGPPRHPVFGPGGHAGPGALGGTPSSARR